MTKLREILEDLFTKAYWHGVGGGKGKCGETPTCDQAETQIQDHYKVSGKKVIDLLTKKSWKTINDRGENLYILSLLEEDLTDLAKALTTYINKEK